MKNMFADIYMNITDKYVTDFYHKIRIQKI